MIFGVGDRVVLRSIKPAPYRYEPIYDDPHYTGITHSPKRPFILAGMAGTIDKVHVKEELVKALKTGVVRVRAPSGDKMVTVYAYTIRFRGYEPITLRHEEVRALNPLEQLADQA